MLDLFLPCSQMHIAVLRNLPRSWRKIPIPAGDVYPSLCSLSAPLLSALLPPTVHFPFLSFFSLL
jgi:hypothetical protein